MISSYIFYFLTVFFSGFFAHVSQKRAKNKYDSILLYRVYLCVSLIILFVVMGFRDITVGVDDVSYLRIFKTIESTTFKSFYSQFSTEPGFYLFNRIIISVFGEFKYVIIFSSFITLYLFYKAIEFESENISLGIAVLVFASTQYFYYFGIVRMGMAVAIVAYSLRFLLFEERGKFLICIMIATSFHFSAIFSVILLLVRPYRKNSFSLTTFRKISMILSVPIVLFVVKFFIYPNIHIAKYQNYINHTGFLNSRVITSLPLFLMIKINKKKLYNYAPKLEVYYNIMIISLLVELFSPIIGIGRLVWYFRISDIILLSALVKIPQRRITKIIWCLIIIVYCFFYCYVAYFGESYRSIFMLPYKSILFN